jgi:hypothetical protein
MHRRSRRQHGYALLFMLIVLVVGSLYSVVSQLDAVQAKYLQAQGTGGTLKLAKDALLGYATTYRDNNSSDVFGYLPCPSTYVGTNPDMWGTADSTCTAGAIGLLPYKTLGLPDLRDADGNCLWYAVSGSFKNSAQVPPLNWDTQGQFTIVGMSVAPEQGDGGAAAVIIAPGAALTAHATQPNGPCRVDPTGIGSYLESYTAATNTFTPGVPGTSNNDVLAWITPKEIFDRIVKRSDFSNPLAASPAGQINTLIDRIRAGLELRIQNDIFKGTSTSLPTNASSYTPAPAGIKVGEVDTAMDVGVVNQPSYATYLANWGEQFRQAVCSDLASPCLDVNNGGTANCRGAVVFGGRTANGQPRTTAQKGSSLAILANYFESGSNTGGLDLLNGSGKFVGSTSYSALTPAADVAACLGAGSFVSLTQNAAAFSSGTVAPNGAGSAVAGVSGVGTGSPAINLGSSTASASSGCVWYPTALPLGSSLRLYFKYRIDSSLTGSTPRGYTFALADANTNSPYSTAPYMCGTSGSAHLGYAGAPGSGTATNGLTTSIIASTSWSSATGNATITTASSHSFSVGNTVTISGAYPGGYNGTYTISWVGAGNMQFRYSIPNPGPNVAGIAPPKLGAEFDMSSNASRNDPGSQHFAALFWGSAADNNPAPSSTTQDGGDDNKHNVGVVGDGSQPLNPRALSITTATATPVANIAAARWTGGTATITTSAPHGFANGQSVVVSDVTALGYKGTYTATVTDSTHFTYPLASDPGPYPYVATMSAATWSGGTATVTTSAAHGLSTGYSTTITNASPSAWNGTYVVTVVDATHFTFTLAANPGTYVLGGQVSYPLTWVNSASWSGGVVTITTAASHKLVTNQYVTISSIYPYAYNGTYRVTVIDTTHFSYALTNPSVNPGSYVSGGLVAIAGATSTVMPATATSSTISAASWSSGTATLTSSAAHGFATGQIVNVSGISPANYNGAYAITVIDATHFSYVLATDPGGSFAATTFANPGISSISGAYPYMADPNDGTSTSTMPYDTDINVRIDIVRSYDAAKHQATVTLKAYMGDTFALTGNCVLSDFQNFSRDLSDLCPTRTPTLEQDGIVVNDVAGPALANIYLGFTTARSATASDNLGLSISDLLLRSQ